MDDSHAPFPLINKQAARTIQGRHTEVLVSSFTDKILIVVSQYGKVGSVVSNPPPPPLLQALRRTAKGN